MSMMSIEQQRVDPGLNAYCSVLQFYSYRIAYSAKAMDVCLDKDMEYTRIPAPHMLQVTCCMLLLDLIAYLIGTTSIANK